MVFAVNYKQINMVRMWSESDKQEIGQTNRFISPVFNHSPIVSIT